MNKTRWLAVVLVAVALVALAPRDGAAADYSIIWKQDLGSRADNPNTDSSCSNVKGDLYVGSLPVKTVTFPTPFKIGEERTMIISYPDCSYIRLIATCTYRRSADASQVTETSHTDIQCQGGRAWIVPVSNNPFAIHFEPGPVIN